MGVGGFAIVKVLDSPKCIESHQRKCFAILVARPLVQSAHVFAEESN
jgi:hypothetical protein